MCTRVAVTVLSLFDNTHIKFFTKVQDLDGQTDVVLSLLLASACIVNNINKDNDEMCCCQK